MRVFEPEVHHIVQFCAKTLSTLLQLHHRHFPFQQECEGQFGIEGVLCDIPLFPFALLPKKHLTEHKFRF